MAHPIVLGTAGHIDHGKTSLVRALTGIDTDRLPVEKARGITTELGFARLDLGERRVAVVDVPGHERFVKSMVAGATGLDLVCLVIAADEGVMPQTREHLDICELLGVRRGLIVLTKRDLVDDEWIAMVSADVRATVAGTFLADAPIVPVSTKTGDGLDELRAALAGAIDALPPRRATGVFRMPIDRVFTVKGFGTVVTGTVLGGEVAVGDDLVVVPSGLATRVRGIEVHGAAEPRAVAGHRAALNLGNIAVDDLARGDLLVHPGRVAPSHILDVELRYLATAPAPLGKRAKVLVHHGTAQVIATLALVDRDTLAPGGTALAQLRLDAATPLGALPGDRFILRGFVTTSTHGSTIGGGSIVRVLAPRARKGGEHAELVARLASARLEQRVALDVQSAAFAGRGIADLVHRLDTPAAAPTRSPRSRAAASCSPSGRARPRVVPARADRRRRRGPLPSRDRRRARRRRRACRARAAHRPAGRPPRARLRRDRRRPRAARRRHRRRRSPPQGRAARRAASRAVARRAAARGAVPDVGPRAAAPEGRAGGGEPPRAAGAHRARQAALGEGPRAREVGPLRPHRGDRGPARPPARVPRRAQDDRRAAVEGAHRREPEVHDPARRVLRRGEADAPHRRRAPQALIRI
ncbi:MAG: selenocysteine-specific translation elongation factor [Deltaproteobacteria bacterium]|nr:selenocysteine-specific translation elongation factor [Deltaproteobacteria bacterium]